MLVCGVDEAGRGSMIGPLVVAGVSIKHSKLPQLSKLGVYDSKKLSRQLREKLYRKIIKLVDNYVVIKIPPKQIDRAVLKHGLNHLEAIYMAKIIKKLNAECSYVDACDVDAHRFSNKLYDLSKKTGIRAHHKADSKFVVVSAASIVAKVRRDKAISQINKVHQVGSGYPSDPKAVEFVRNCVLRGQIPEFVRKSWSPVRILSSQL